MLDLFRAVFMDLDKEDLKEIMEDASRKSEEYFRRAEALAGVAEMLSDDLRHGNGANLVRTTAQGTLKALKVGFDLYKEEMGKTLSRRVDTYSSWADGRAETLNEGEVPE